MPFDIREELKKLPDRPGVYIMHDAEGEILYVGKATSLRNRVKSYFAKTVNRGPQILKMIREIAWFETILVDSETEALVLECNLIKENHPRYNTRLMDDKAYPYISLTVGEAYPRVRLARTMKRDANLYFGPYTNITAVRETIRLLQTIFCIRTCSRKLPETCGKERPCLNYDMHRCPAPCRGDVTPEAYRENIDRAIRFLKGDHGSVLKLLEEKMKAAAAELDFEEAARYRDLIGSVNALSEKQKVTDTDQEDRDILALAAENGEGIAEFFFIRGGRMIGRDHYHLNVEEGESTAATMSLLIREFYSGTPYVPREILVMAEPEDREALEELLTLRAGRKVEIRMPKIGEKHKLMEMARDNAKRLLDQEKDHLLREEARTGGAQQELASLMGLSDVHRIEAYDISHISGFATVGSMVVYEAGRPRKNEYRKFRLRFVEGANDTASLTEVLYRRFSHGLREKDLLREKGMDEEGASFVHFPDLILMDGGKGQVHAAEEVLAELDLMIPVCGMVKDDRHRTRGLYYEDREIPIDPRSEAFKLMTRIQDETHRFAIEYHRSLRGKAQVHSVLDDIPGIGPARRRALMNALSDIEAIRAADGKTLAAIPGMTRETARTVYAFFHDGELPEL